MPENSTKTGSSTSTGKRIERFGTLRFFVQIKKDPQGGTIQATFAECSGLQAETELFTYEEGGLNDTVHQLPGRTKFGNVTLKRGVATSNELWDWYYKVVTGNVERQNVSIILYRPNSGEAMRWNLANAFPVKWVGPSFVSSENAVAVETLELAHEGIEVLAHEETDKGTETGKK